MERKSLYANVFSLEIFPRHNNFPRFYGTHIQQYDSTDGTNWVSSSRQQFKRLPVIFFEFIGKNYIFYHHLREPGKSKSLAPIKHAHTPFPFPFLWLCLMAPFHKQKKKNYYFIISLWWKREEKGKELLNSATKFPPPVLELPFSLLFLRDFEGKMYVREIRLSRLSLQKKKCCVFDALYSTF